MQYQFFTDSEKSWQAMFRSMSEAKESIYMEMYIFEDDMGEFKFFDLLREKSAAGLRVRLILDAFGSFDLSNSKIAELKKSGAEILFVSYLLHRTHRKILIVDEYVAFIGGVNMHQSARLWNDLLVKAKGKLVESIVKSFAKSYRNAGGRDPALLARKRKNILIDAKAWTIDHFPANHHSILKKIYRKHIRNARTDITLITPYFMPKRWLALSLHQAVLRGVAVTVLVPEHTDHFLIDRVNYFYIYELSKLGVRFYLEPEMNHAKAMLMDQSECLIGSQNLDFLSFDYNAEIGVFFRDARVVSELQAIADNWKKDSILFDPEKYEPQWFDYLLSPFIKIFFRIF